MMFYMTSNPRPNGFACTLFVDGIFKLVGGVFDVLHAHPIPVRIQLFSLSKFAIKINPPKIKMFPSLLLIVFQLSITLHSLPLAHPLPEPPLVSKGTSPIPAYNPLSSVRQRDAEVPQTGGSALGHAWNFVVSTFKGASDENPEVSETRNGIIIPTTLRPSNPDQPLKPSLKKVGTRPIADRLILAENSGRTPLMTETRAKKHVTWNELPPELAETEDQIENPDDDEYFQCFVKNQWRLCRFREPEETGQHKSGNSELSTMEKTGNQMTHEVDVGHDHLDHAHDVLADLIPVFLMGEKSESQQTSRTSPYSKPHLVLLETTQTSLDSCQESFPLYLHMSIVYWIRFWG